MQNLDQIRAAKAFPAAENTSKQAVSKLPAIIMTNGLLAAIAFADERKDGGAPKREKMQHAMDAVADHLSCIVEGITLPPDAKTGSELLRALTTGNANSLLLQRATTEALAFLSFLKRFTTKDEI
ncbi:MAG: hypothetical protein NTW21_36805 [Verrucomicrobia bacterium]|nr:hypothetical protein [Verrucomicrobiota bacterium]